MKRREFLGVLGGAAATWPLVARAQQPAMPVVGFLHPGSPASREHFMAAFRQGLGESGYVEGQNVAIEYRWAEHDYTRLPNLAAELVRLRVSVIAALSGAQTALAAKRATTSIPIVFSVSDDPASRPLTRWATSSPSRVRCAPNRIPAPLCADALNLYASHSCDANSEETTCRMIRNRADGIRADSRAAKVAGRSARWRKQARPAGPDEQAGSGWPARWSRNPQAGPEVSSTTHKMLTTGLGHPARAFLFRTDHEWFALGEQTEDFRRQMAPDRMEILSGAVAEKQYCESAPPLLPLLQAHETS